MKCRLFYRKPLLLWLIDDMGKPRCIAAGDVAQKRGRRGASRSAFIQGLLVWRKLLIACVLGVSLWNAAAATNTAHDTRSLIQPALSATDEAAVKRIALVIGNSSYAGEALANPVNDARAMERALVSLGFEVMRRENLTRHQMAQALDEFQHRLGAGGVGLFYFSGHGLRVSGKTMLAATDANSRRPASLLTHGMDLQQVLQSMAGPRPGRLNLVILDTCLNTPFPSADAGMSPPPDDTLIAYATAPGSFAADGARHGIYTAALLKALAAPAEEIGDVFRHASATVRDATGRQQLPWIASSLTSAYRLAAQTAPGGADIDDETVVDLRSRAILPKDSAEQYELAFWDSIKDSKHASDYEAYLNAYPKGRFAALARARIERLRAAEEKAAAQPEKAPAAPPKAKAEPERPRPPAAKAPVAKTPPAPAEQARPEAVEKPATAVSVSEVKDCPTCPTMVVLPAGSFTMGSNTTDPSEKPAHRVTIAEPFAIAKHEVTVEQWEACVAAGACPRVADNGNRPQHSPVRDVSWDDAQQYVKWLSQVTGKHYRLPTEAEWEYAARGGTSTRYWWGEKMRAGQANCKECGDPWTAEGPANVGSFAANAYGLHDMSGSVWEWVSDCWHTSYRGAPADGKSWDTPNCRDRVIRGGSWRDGANYMPASTRFKYSASVRHSQNGFRVARDVK